MVRYKQIEHEVMTDAPFVGAVISAIGCGFNCEGCFNQHLKEMKTKVNSAETIIAEIRKNPLNEGIIFGGLEWSEQPLELVELLEEAKKYNLKVMIYTGCELAEFEAIIGKACAEKTGYAKQFQDNIWTEDDKRVYAFMGNMLLDHYIPNDYYIKIGRYDQSKPSEEREFFGVKLASDNQVIYQIKKAEEE